MLTTEKVTRKSLDADDHKRLVDEALAEVDFGELAPKRPKGRELMEEIARVYAEALFDAAKEAEQARRRSTSSSTSSPTRSTSNREMQLFFFSPYFSSTEKKEGLDKAIERGRARAASTSSSC